MCVFMNKINMIFMILNIIGDIFVGPIKQLFKINKPFLFFVVFRFTCLFVFHYVQFFSTAYTQNLY